MRIPTATCLAIVLCTTEHSFSHASIRHLSSRLLEGGGNESFPIGAGFFGQASPGFFAAGANGEVFLLASADSFVSFGNAPVGPGVVAARLHASGADVWSRVLNVTVNTRINGIAPTPDGGMAITGSFRGTVDFGGGPLTSVQGSGDVFVLKLDAAGALAWQRGFGDRFEQTGNGVTVAPNGDILVTGSNQLVVDFGGGPIRSNGAFDIFLARLDQDGAHVWSRGFGQIGTQEGTVVTTGKDGSIAIACRMNGGGVDFGGGLLTELGDDDVVLAVLDSAGTHVWSRLAGSQLDEFATDISFDESGNLSVCGWFRRRLDLGDTALIATQTASTTGFVASFNATGGYRWSHAIVDSLESICWKIGTDESGNSLVIATKETSIEIADEELPPAGYLLLAYDPVGTLLCGTAFGDPPAPNQVSDAVYVAVVSNVIHLAGSTPSPIDLGGGTLNPDGRDIFLARLALRREPLVTITDFTARATGGDVEVRWNLQSGEPLAGYLLTRRIDSAPTAQVIAAAPAIDGDTRFVDQNTQPGHRHTYSLTVETALGDPVFAGPASIHVPAVENVLAQNAPNPFNPLTTIAYSLSAPADVSIVIWDVTGAVIARLEQGMKPAGTHEATWGGHNAHGAFVGSGVYFYRLEGVPDAGARKMVLLK